MTAPHEAQEYFCRLDVDRAHPGEEFLAGEVEQQPGVGLDGTCGVDVRRLATVHAFLELQVKVCGDFVLHGDIRVFLVESLRKLVISLGGFLFIVHHMQNDLLFFESVGFRFVGSPQTAGDDHGCSGGR